MLDLLDSIDSPVDVLVSMTPDAELEAEVLKRGYPIALSPRGNPAQTTLAGLSKMPALTVLLVDSDCLFLPGAIARMRNLSNSADIVRPTVVFLHHDFSSWATAICRDFQYTYNNFVYEPGLLVRLDRVLPTVQGYLFSPFAPFTPDGEFDFRVRRTNVPITTDPMPTITHASLSFTKHLYSYWRYGCSEASRMRYLGQPVLREVLKGLPTRYKVALSSRYHWATPLLMVPCDIVYLASMIWNWAVSREVART